MLKNLYRPIFTSLLLSALTATSAWALPTDYFASNSRLASGHWVKVKVTENGVHQLTFDQLREMGFANPEKVAVFGYPSWQMGTYDFSASRPDDLPSVPSMVYADKLLFYGEGNFHQNVTISNSSYQSSFIRNLDGIGSYYYLTDAVDPEGINVVEEVPTATPYPQTVRGLASRDFRDRKPGIANISGYLVSQNCATEQGDFQFYLPGMKQGDNSASVNTTMTCGITTFNKSSNDYIALRMTGYNATLDTPTTITKKILVAGGWNPSTSYKSFYYQHVNTSWNNLLVQEDDTYNLSMLFYNECESSELGFDYVTFTYPRTTDLGSRPQEQMIFESLQQYQPIVLYNTCPTTRVWNISQPAKPYEMVLTQVGQLNGKSASGFTSDAEYELKNNNALRVVVFDPERELPSPVFEGIVANQNLHSMEVPEMLIVSSPDNLDQANRLAELHRLYTGTEVAVVEFSQVCNEFGSGSRHPMAIRRMAKMFHDRNPEKFKALLLFARAPRDNNGVAVSESREQFENLYIPMLQCQDISAQYCGGVPTSYATDAIYGMLNDDFIFDNGSNLKFRQATLDIMVGRIPASNQGQALAYVNKVEKYLTNPSKAPLFNNTLLMSDTGDSNMHINQGIMIRSQIGQSFPSTMTTFAVKGFYDLGGTGYERLRNKIRTTLSRGAGMWMFVGHSATTQIALAWSLAEDKDLVIQDPPFTCFGTCNSMVMDDTKSSLQVDMLFNEHGGSIAGVGSIRSVYADYNHFLMQMMSHGYCHAKVGSTYGQIYKDGRNWGYNNPGQLSESMLTPAYINNLSFNYLGDPMLPMLVPQHKVQVTQVNGSEDFGQLTFDPYTKQSVAGEILNNDGTLDSDFNGTVLFQIYDGNHTVSTAPSLAYVNNNVADERKSTELQINIDEDLLQEVTFEVKNGRFAGDIYCALPTYLGTYNRINIFAQSTDLASTAVGTLDNVLITRNLPDDSELENIEKPEITSIYAISPEFSNGDCLPANFTLYAEVNPGTLGLMGVSDRLGGAMNLTIDNGKHYSNVDSHFSLGTDGKGKLVMPINNLVDGRHTLTFTVVDVAGNSVSESINFVVANVTEGKLTVDNEFAKADVTISLDHGYDLDTKGRLVVTNPGGEVIRNLNGDNNEGIDLNSPFTWDLTDDHGQRVAPGIYFVTAYFKAERHYGHAAPARIIVAKN